MPCFLALECSMAEGSLALLEFDKKNLNCLASKKWLHHFKNKHSQNSHSDRLPIEIDQILKEADKTLSDLTFLAVGIGPGRWTGVRTAVSVIRTLSFCLNIPVYPVNSLRICAEKILSQSKSVFVAMNGFKNQVYFAEFHSEQEMEGELNLLAFQDWQKYMEKKEKSLKEKKSNLYFRSRRFLLSPTKFKRHFLF